MIIMLDNDLYENKTNEEILKIISDILNNNFNYPGVSITYNENKQMPKFTLS